MHDYFFHLSEIQTMLTSHSGSLLRKIVTPIPALQAI